MEKIKAVIFDWGGVLIDDPAPCMAEYIGEKLKVSTGEAKNAHGKYIIDFQKGIISETEFWKNVCNILKVNIPNSNSLWNEAFRYSYSPKKEIFDLAVSLKESGYKTAVLSNTEEPAMKYFYELNYRMFDALIFSCAEKTVKPEKEIYEIALNRLKIKPYEAIFIDDILTYIKGAQNAGLKSILFKNPKNLIEQLLSYSINIR